MQTEPLRYGITNGIAILSLSAPPRNNTDKVFFDCLSELIMTIENASPEGLIIRAEGRHFSSGADIDELLTDFTQTNKRLPDTFVRNRKLISRISELNLPSVACIKGICYGSGLELALSTHFRIAAPGSLLSLPENSFGLIPGLGGISHTVQCSGKAKAFEMILTNTTLSAEQALENSLIDFLIPKSKQDNFARKIIQSVKTGYRKELKNYYISRLKTD